MAFRTIESLDTNIILRMMLRDIPEQCVRIVDLFMRHGVTYKVDDLAITEVVYVMQGQGFSRREIVDRLAETVLDEAEPLWTFDQDLAKELGTAKLVK